MNFRAVATLIERSRLAVSDEDVLVLPELIGGASEHKDYEQLTIDLACRIGCHVIGGTNHRKWRGNTVNSGVAVDPQGRIVAAHDKLRPYGIESRLGLCPGIEFGQFEIRGCRVLVVVCADFWYSNFLRIESAPDPI